MSDTANAVERVKRGLRITERRTTVLADGTVVVILGRWSRLRVCPQNSLAVVYLEVQLNDEALRHLTGEDRGWSPPLDDLADHLRVCTPPVACTHAAVVYIMHHVLDGAAWVDKVVEKACRNSTVQRMINVCWLGRFLSEHPVDWTVFDAMSRLEGG